MKLGRYEIVRELGKGAMGIVYLAKDPLIGRLVALKTIRPAVQGDDDETREFQQRFIREAQAAGILNHPAIVTVFDIGQDDTSGISFIAMEYVEGQNLKEVLAQGRPLSFAQIGDIIAQIAEALDFAHAKGIVHRDVKPANIILLEGDRAKIMDFGIAKIASGAVNLTTTGQFLGTPNYMAPEQIKGAPVDGRTDIFALGICLYECLTRRKPFGGDSLTSISYKIVHEPFASLREINPQIPDGFEEIAGRCLAKDPTKRYQRARDLGNALRAVNRGEKPAAIEPMQVEETIVTRDRDKIPTVEVPFPEAVEVEENGLQTNASSAAGAAAAVAVLPGAPAAAARPAVRRPQIADHLRKTLHGVRTMPLWKRPVPTIAFFAIVGVLVIGLLGGIAAIQAGKPRQRAIDTAAEKLRQEQRKARMLANSYYEQGKLNEALLQWQLLGKMAPNSPAVAEQVQKLSAIRQQQEVSRQQVAQARQKLDQAIVVFNQRKYAESIPLFEEAAQLNPNDDAAARYLELARHAQEISDQEKAARAAAIASSRAVTVTQANSATAGRTTTAAGPRPVSNIAPAQLTTVFNSPVTDGYIMVRAGSQVAAHENLWQESGRFFKRKTPRNVSVTKELTPANMDVDVWVVIPSLNIQEHKLIAKQNFPPGASRKLVVTFDPQNKKFDYQLN